MTSWANNTPAIGALKLADIAEATPAASRVRRDQSGSENRSPTALASVAPRWITGPSRPALAPEPREKAVASELTIPSRRLRRRPEIARASITSATPPVRREGRNRAIMTPTTMPPITGPERIMYQGVVRAAVSTCSDVSPSQ